MSGIAVLYFVCYLVALLLFLIDAGCRLSNRIAWNSTWMTPLGLFFWLLPQVLEAFRRTS